MIIKVQSVDSIDSLTSEYKNWPVQSKDHNAGSFLECKESIQ